MDQGRSAQRLYSLGGLAAVRASLSVWAGRQRERLKHLGDLLQHTVSAPHVLANAPPTERIELPETDEPERLRAEGRRAAEKTRTD